MEFAEFCIFNYSSTCRLAPTFPAFHQVRGQLRRLNSTHVQISLYCVLNPITAINPVGDPSRLHKLNRAEALKEHEELLLAPRRFCEDRAKLLQNHRSRTRLEMIAAMNEKHFLANSRRACEPCWNVRGLLDATLCLKSNLQVINDKLASFKWISRFRLA